MSTLPSPTFPYTTRFRSLALGLVGDQRTVLQRPRHGRLRHAGKARDVVHPLRTCLARAALFHAYRVRYAVRLVFGASKSNRLCNRFQNELESPPFRWARSAAEVREPHRVDRKSTRLNFSH